MATPGRNYWASYEPAIGPVDFRRIEARGHLDSSLDAPSGSCMVMTHDGGGIEQYPRLGRVVCGGESGPGARPCDSMTRYFDGVPSRIRDRAGADPAEWPEDLRVRERMP